MTKRLHKEAIARLKRLEALEEPQDKEKNKALWDEFRIGKAYACMGDMLEMAAAFSLKQEMVSNNNYKESGPRNGSIYYIEQIDPPGWFKEEELR